ncbi:MAG TPA: hypothetical protein VNS88_09710 [Nitrospiraceae bacterium]|nr:hypothetical protein [Nitrospiraceae bacterium]
MFDGPYIVMAAKVGRDAKDAGYHAFGLFVTEDEAAAFVDKVTASPDWEVGEIPVLNKPEVFGTGDERLLCQGHTSSTP